MAKAKTDSVSGVEGQEGVPTAGAPLLPPDTPETPATPVAETPVAAEPKPWDIDEAGNVLVHVPQAFGIAINSHTDVHFKPGEQRMHFSYLEHWYVKANGVKPV